MMNGTLAKGQWWFLFNAVPNLAEALLTEYLRAYRQPGAVMGACNDYRAGPEDISQDNEDQDVKLTCPVLALWGADFEWVGRAYDVAGIWADMASDLRTVEIPDCRHLPHEEQPDQVNGHLLRFLVGD